MISYTLPEIRRLLVSLIQRYAPDPARVWAWSHWRRRRQYQARLCHYRRRGYAFALAAGQAVRTSCLPGPGVTALYSVCRRRPWRPASDPVPRISEEGLEMAISVVAQVEDLTAEEDAALLAALDLEGSPPTGGRIVRMAGPQGGGRRITGIWDSETDYERFRDDRLMPALRGLGRALQVIEKRPATETVRILSVT